MKDFYSRYNQKGSTSVTIFAALFLIALSAFFILLLNMPKSPAPQGADLKTSADDAKLVKLQGEFTNLFISLSNVETMRNRGKYLEIVGAAEKRLIESDNLWEKKLETQKGLFNGMIGGLNENYESRFTSADKLQMLSEKYGIPAGRLRTLKADLEIMFLDEFAEKFSGADESPAQETKEEGAPNTANRPKSGKT